MSANKQPARKVSYSGAAKDAHICGQCAAVFVSIKAFVSHKKKGCSADKLNHGEKKSTADSQGDVTQDKLCVDNDSSVSTEAKPDAEEKKKYKCDYSECNYSSKYPKDLQRHMRIHTGERPYQCEECGKSFSRLDKFKLHSRCHSGLKPYKCSHCDYAATDGSSLKKHLRIHTDERPFKCQICMYASRNSSQLVVHLRTHTGDTPFHCPHCPSKFKINSDLKRHVRLHTGDKPYQCTHCDYKCAVNGNLKTHVRLNHSTQNVYSCDKCEFNSPSKKLLIQHEKCHCPAPIQCPHQQCPYKCQSETSLRNHMRSHSKERPFKCVHCSYTSRQPGNVRTHVRKHHCEKTGHCKVGSGSRKTGRGDAVCKTVCSRPFKCNVCPSSFVRQDSLRSHLRQHQRLQKSTEDVVVDESSAAAVLSEMTPETVVSVSADSSVFGFYPSVVENTAQQQQQVIYQLQPGVNVLSVAPTTSVQYVFQASDSCIMLEAAAEDSDLVAAAAQSPLVNVCDTMVSVNQLGQL